MADTESLAGSTASSDSSAVREGGIREGDEWLLDSAGAVRAPQRILVSFFILRGDPGTEPCD